MTDTATLDAPESLDDARDQADAIAAAEPAPADAKPKRTRAPRKRAPRARAPKADKAPRTPPATKRPTSLRAQLEESIAGIGLLVFVVNQADGQLIIAGAPKQARALDQLAKENPAVRGALERLLRTSTYAQLAMAFAPTLLGIAANHGLVPPMVGAIAGLANSSPAAGDGATPEAPGPAAGVDLTDLAGLAGLAAMFDGGNDGPPFGVVAGAHAVG